MRLSSYKLGPHEADYENDPKPRINPPKLKNDLNRLLTEVETRKFITKIIIHCSDSTWGDFKIIDQWHSERVDSDGVPWKGVNVSGKQMYCGYHYIILNGKRLSGGPYVAADDGLLEKGRPDNYIGAHCRGQNMHSLGICLIGGKKEDDFTDKQLKALAKLLDRLVPLYSCDKIFGHCDFSPKACPQFNVKDFVLKWSGGYYGL